MELEQQHQKALQEITEKSEHAVAKIKQRVVEIIKYRGKSAQQPSESSAAGSQAFFKKDAVNNSDSNLELIGQGCKKTKEELENINALTKDNTLETAATFGFGASQSSSNER